VHRESSSKKDVTANEVAWRAASLIQGEHRFPDTLSPAFMLTVGTPTAGLQHELHSDTLGIEAPWIWAALAFCCFGLALTGVAVAAASHDSLDPPPDDVPEGAEQGSTDRWPTICALLFFMATFCDGALGEVIIPLTPQLRGLFNVGDPMIGILFASKGFVQMLSAPIVGESVNKIGPRSVICGGLFVEVASTVLYALSGSSYPTALCARAIQGVASSCILVGSQCFVASTAGENTSSLLALSFMGFSGCLGGPNHGWMACLPIRAWHLWHVWSARRCHCISVCRACNRSLRGITQ